MTFLRNLSKNKFKKTHLGLLTETHGVILRFLKIPHYSCIQDGGTHRRPFPPDHIVDLKEVAMGWVLRLTEPQHKIQ